MSAESNPIIAESSALAQLAESFQSLPEFPGGNCIGHARANVFYDDDAASLREAKGICVGCPELQKCRSYAITHEVYGVWGGLSARERHRLRTGQKVPDLAVLSKAQTRLELLRSKLPAREVAARLGCTERTVYRQRKQLKNSPTVALQIRTRKTAKLQASQYELVS